MDKNAIRKAARLAGVRKFFAECPRHGEGLHYTSSGRCMKCAAQAKAPRTQKQYWDSKRAAINAARREKRRLAS